MKKTDVASLVSALGALCGSALAHAVAISDTPLFLTVSAPPAVLFNLSVETPMGGAAYSGTYSAASEFLGIFDPKKCYTYSSGGAGASGMNGRFEPAAVAGANHSCGSQWSGNFLNWATMRAIDMVIWNLTGGNRVRDTAGASAETVLRAARSVSDYFLPRSNVAIPSGAAPVSGTFTIQYPGNYSFTLNGSTYNIQVLVCKASSPGPESNCTAYTDNATTPHTYYKPEGLIQKNAEKMRFALTSYTLDSTQARDGGVLRSNLKYVGPRKWDDANRAWVDNDAKEWWGATTVTGSCSSPNPTTPGLLIANPEQCNQDSDLNVPASSNLKSGVIAYINQFSDQGYKSYDPAGELFYESLNYFRNRGPTPEYSKADNSNGRTLSAITRNSTDSKAGGFWFYNENSEWKDPISYSCQRNFIIGINDANPWLDKRLPGTYFTDDKIEFTILTTQRNKWRGTTGCMTPNPTTGISPCDVLAGDFGEPSRSDTAINVTTLTNQVGVLEGLNGITWSASNTPNYYPGIVVNGVSVTATITDPIRGILWQKDSVGGSVASSGNGSFDNGCSNKTVSALGEVMGTCPYPGKQNSYYIAGLAYWANTQDIRPDLSGKQTVNTYMIDSQEPQPGGNILDGPRNMLWLTGKYGGFIDKNNNNQPDLTEEWNKANDGIPENYVFASDPQKLQDGLNRAFSNIYDLSTSGADSSSSAVAANSTRLDLGSVIFQMKFNPLDWTGQVLAQTLNKDGTIKSVEWDSDTTLGRISAFSAGTRNIVTWNPDTNQGSRFECGGSTSGKSWMDPTVTAAPDNVGCWLTPNQRAALRESGLINPLPSGVNWDDLLDYLRGDPTNETGGSGRKSFRSRPMTLGDIVNSDPMFVGDENLGYDVLDEADGGGSIYAAYRFATESRQKMLYVGANDGMLHAFDSTTGAEMFTYVPNEVIRDSSGTDRMKQLAALNYTHKYFVDGSPNFSDVYVGGVWKTYLVASQGAGGRAIFTLNISAETSGPDTNKVVMTKDKVLWEFGPNSDSNASSKSAEIGYVLSQPAVVRMPNKRWAAIFGNGPGGSSGKAKLFVIYLDANVTDTNKWELGKDYLIFDTDDTTSNASITGNGLNGVSVLGDDYLTAQYVYAGDLLGRLWKFDLTGITSANITCSASTSCGTGTKIFAAPNNRPITSAPVIGPHSKCGKMLYFGTGKYYETGDQLNVDLQTMYGIWDQPNGALPVAASDLYEYQIDKQGTAASGTEWRVIADNNLSKITDLYAPASASGNPDVCKQNNPDAPKKRGWFIDLKVKGTTINTGERVVARTLLRHGRAIFTTLESSKTFCAGGGKSWVMEMTAESGAPLNYGVFDINKDNVITAKVTPTDCGDCVVNSAGLPSLASGVSTGAMGIIKTPTVLTAGGLEYKIGSGSTAGELVVIKEKGSNAPRASWRQLQ